MYCSNCGSELSKTAKFCSKCGFKTVQVSLSNDIHKFEQKIDRKSEKITLNEEERKKLIKAYQNAGNSSFAIGIVNIVLLPVVVYFLNNITDIVILIVYAVDNIIFMIPFIYYGKKIKSDNLDDLHRSLKLNRGMFIYSIVFFVIVIFSGGQVGLLFLLIIYYFGVSYYATKKLINQ
jgi:hypothetical protein